MVASTFEAAPARLVHKLAADEVLLDGWRRTGEGGFLVATRWPREHGYYFAPDGRPDPMLVIETVRQCLPLLSHAAFDVPLDHRLVWESFGVSLSPDALAADQPLDDVEIEARCADLRVRGGRAADITLAFVVRRHDEELATARTRFFVQTPAVYQRIRGAAAHTSSAQTQPTVPPAAVDAAAVGRSAPSDVLLSPADRPNAWQLRVDTTHPIFFDHPVDHVPGALLIDAALQAARACLPVPGEPLPARAIECEFATFVELCDACLIEARPLAADQPGHERVRVTFTQPVGGPVFSALVTLDRPAAPFPDRQEG